MFLEWIFFGKIFSEKIFFCGKEQMTPPGVENFVPARKFPGKYFGREIFFFLLAKYFPGKNLGGNKKSFNPTVAFSLNLSTKNLERE